MNELDSECYNKKVVLQNIVHGGLEGEEVPIMHAIVHSEPSMQIP